MSFAFFAKYLGFQVILKFPKHTPFRNLFFAAPMGTKGVPRTLSDLNTCGDELRTPWSSSFMCAMCCSTDAKFTRRFLIGNCPLAPKGETKSNQHSIRFYSMLFELVRFGSSSRYLLLLYFIPFDSIRSDSVRCASIRFYPILS